MNKKPRKNEENDGLSHRLYTVVSNHHYAALMSYQKKTGVDVGRLIATAIDRELLRNEPFKFDLTIPSVDESYVEYAYIEEAGKILNLLRKHKTGLTLYFLVLCRHDIGVPEKETFMLAFRECIDKGFVEECVKFRRGDKTPYKAWRLKGAK
jgi:hypothetical protein